MSAPRLESCERHGEPACYRGFRTDYLAADHYGVDTPETRACDAGTMPCEHHRCYYWEENHAAEDPARDVR